MCLYPRKYRNAKYLPTKKNGGQVPLPPIIGWTKEGFAMIDKRVLEIEIPCGNCEECRKQKAREWQIRLSEELKDWQYSYFLTLTFKPSKLREICLEKEIKESNAAAGYALRHCLEYYRKDHKHSLRHWFVTELGHEGTERIHLHGIVFSNEPLEFTELSRKQQERYKTNPYADKMRNWKYWLYGHVGLGDYCSERTINYIVKYINKIDLDHKGFRGQVLASPGIGRRWIEDLQYRPVDYGYRPGRTIDYYTLGNGVRVKMPTYYKNKLLNEREREQVWREFMDTCKETIAGNTYLKGEITTNEKNKIRWKAQEVNIRSGYGNDSKEWRKIPYNITRRMCEEKYRLEHRLELVEQQTTKI